MAAAIRRGHGIGGCQERPAGDHLKVLESVLHRAERLRRLARPSLYARTQFIEHIPGNLPRQVVELLERFDQFPVQIAHRRGPAQALRPTPAS